MTKDGQTFEHTAKNTLEKGIVKIHKVDQNGKALAGVEFTLTDNLGNKQTAVTDKDGNAQFAIVANRMYSLKETKTLAGYVGSFQKDGITKVPTLVHYKKGKVVTQYTGYREQQIDKVLAGGKAGEFTFKTKTSTVLVRLSIKATTNFNLLGSIRTSKTPPCTSM